MPLLLLRSASRATAEQLWVHWPAVASTGQVGLVVNRQCYHASAAQHMQWSNKLLHQHSPASAGDHTWVLPMHSHRIQHVLSAHLRCFVGKPLCCGNLIVWCLASGPLNPKWPGKCLNI